MASSPELAERLMRLTARCNRVVIYYSWETARRSKIATIIQVMVLVVAFGSASTLLTLFLGLFTLENRFLELIVPALNFAVAFGVIISLTWNHPYRVSQLYATSGKCREILIRLEALHADMPLLEDREFIEQMKSLDAELENATAPVEAAGIGYNRSRNDEAQKDAWKITYDKFGISSGSTGQTPASR